MRSRRDDNCSGTFLGRLVAVVADVLVWRTDKRFALNTDWRPFGRGRNGWDIGSIVNGLGCPKRHFGRFGKRRIGRFGPLAVAAWSCRERWALSGVRGLLTCRIGCYHQDQPGKKRVVSKKIVIIIIKLKFQDVLNFFCGKFAN